MSDVLELENEIYQDEPEQSTEQVEEEFIAPVLNQHNGVERGKFRSLTLINWNGFFARTFDLDELVTTLSGGNGAGKSTMMDIITGKTRPDSGTAWFGQTCNLLEMDEPAIAKAGIGRKFQKPTIFENLSVDENLELAMKAPKTVLTTLFGKINSEQSDMRDHVLELTNLIDLRNRPGRVLSHGQKQWLEIAMLLMQKPKLLLVDEPVTGMTRQEMEKTGELLVSLSGSHSVIVVEHDMDFVRQIARKVTVLHQGHVLSEGTMDQVQSDPKVIEVYLGAE